MATVDLPAPVSPTSAIDWPGRDVQVDVRQHRRARAVAELDAVEPDVAAGVREPRRVHRLRDGRLLGEQAGDFSSAAVADWNEL